MEQELNKRIFGQPELTKAVADFLYYHALRQLHPELPQRPLLISGPSGSGKTEVWRVASRLYSDTLCSTFPLDESAYLDSIYSPYSRVSQIQSILKRYGTALSDVVSQEELHELIATAKTNKTGVRAGRKPSAGCHSGAGSFLCPAGCVLKNLNQIFL